MRQSIIILLILSLTSIGAMAQPLTETASFLNFLATPSSSAILPDGTIAASGCTNPIAKNDGLLMKFTPAGEIAWMDQFADTSSEAYGIFNFQTTSVSKDGAIIAAGLVILTLSQQPVAVSTNNDGTLRWACRYSIGASALINASCPTHDNGVLFVGQWFPSKPVHWGERFGFIFKVDSTGTPLWCRTISVNSDTAQHIETTAVMECTDSTIILANSVLPHPGDSGHYTMISLLRLESNGTLITQSSYASITSDIFPSHLLQLSDGSIVLAGSTRVGHGLQPILLQFTDIGHLQRATQYSFIFPSQCESIFQTAFGGLCGLFTTFPEQYIITVNSSGTVKAAANIFKERPGPYATLQPLRSSPTRYAYISSEDFSATIDSPSINYQVFSDTLEGCNVEPATVTTTIAEIQDTALAMQYSDGTVIQSKQTFSMITHHPGTTVLCSTVPNTVRSDFSTGPILAHPNPSSAHHPIKIDLSYLNTDSYLVVMRDLVGKEVYRSALLTAASGLSTELPTISLPSGIYIVEVLEANSLSVIGRQKVVIE